MAETEHIVSDARATLIQTVIHAFISADISHRRAIERWATNSGIHRSQHRMLMYLSKCETTPSQKELAKHFDISPAAVTVTLQKLESDGFIKRNKCVSGGDSRPNEIKITDLGRDACTQSRKYFHQVDADTFKDFSDDELNLFVAFLERMQENLKAMESLPANTDNGKHP